MECAREAKGQQVQRTLLCLTAPAAKDALSYAATLDPPMQIIERRELQELAGLAQPATDEVLRTIGRQKRTRRSPIEWLAVILDASRARRYLVYGIGMTLLALFTGNSYYPFPAAVCLLLYAGCKIRQLYFNGRTRWKA